MQNISGISVEDLGLIDGKKMLIEVELEGATGKDWAKENAAKIDSLLNENGALLIRGLKLQSSKKLGMILAQLFGSALLEYNYRSTPRTKMRGNVYTSSEYHSQQTIVQHNEAAYSNVWPMRIGFSCIQAPASGGQTPITDSHEIYKNLPTDIVKEFEQKGLMYVRNYSEVDLPWTEVFQTNKREEVEAYCDKNRIEYEWIGDENFRTKQRTHTTLEHPVKGKKVWFNQAHLFHISSLAKENQDDLLNMYGEENLPRNVYFGDGSVIDGEVLNLVRSLYVEQQIAFDWVENDLMLLDNMLFTHGRNPFSGDRKILVGMARSYSV